MTTATLHATPIHTTPTADLAADPGVGVPGWSATGLPLEDLAGRVAGDAGRINAATCAWLGLVAEADRRTAWQGFPSAGSWLSWLCGIAPGTAREHVRVARALERLPLVRARFATGAITYSQARALTRFTGTLAESTLVDLASYATGAQLERLLRSLARATRGGEDAAARDRTARWFIDHDGTLVVRARLAGPDAALVMAALDHARDHAEPDPGDGWSDAAAHTAADALVALARAYAGSPRADRPASDETSTPRPSGRALVEPVAVHVIVDADELAAAVGPSPDSAADRGANPDPDPDRVPAGTPARLEPTGVTITRGLLAALTCHAPAHVLASLADGTLVDLGRTRRAPSRAIARAVLRRHGNSCAYPGCHARRHLHLHHITHWAHGGDTSTGNLVPLCGHHHRSLHHGDYRIQHDGEIAFIRADGVPIPRLGTAITAGSTGPALADDPSFDHADATGRGIARTPGRDTSRIDHDYATAVLLANSPHGDPAA